MGRTNHSSVEQRGLSEAGGTPPSGGGRANNTRVEQPGRVQPWWRRSYVWALAVAVLAFLAYWPCLRGEFIWDDDAWTTKLAPLFQNASGLRAIWSWPTPLQQYYPLTATTFWIDYQLWGFWTVPYHVENLLLHLLAAGLFWKLLKRLDVPGAGLAAAILVLHPLMVESVAWITERKNVLSLVLFLAALLTYGRFANLWEVAVPRNRRAWAWALFLFLAAYLAKATTVAFPAVVLLLCWWKRGRLRWREDVLPTLPFFAVSFGLGLMTSWLERYHLGARGPDWDIPFPEQCVIAGRALWFYVGKLLCPADHCFIYPRWDVEGRSLLRWLWPVSALAVPIALWLLRRRIGRGPLVGVLFFAGTLFPLLGFFNGAFMRYSFVSDHWAYLPSLGLIALAAPLVTAWAERRRVLVYGLGGMMLATFVTLIFLQSGVYSDAETLYRATLAKNPNADLAHNNLGLVLFQAGQTEEAMSHFQQAVDIRPSSAHAHNNLANALRLAGRTREAAAQYEASLKYEPHNPGTCNNLAMLLAMSPDASLRNGPRAVELAQHANQLTGRRNPLILGTLAAAYAETGRFAEAAATARTALELASRHPNIQLAESLRMQIQRYESGLPLHDSGRQGDAPKSVTP
ncbi:MAG: tetratricopeptide repeat protein [Limisphaerales bacterium]